MLTFSNTRYRRTSCNSASALVANRYGFCTSPANAAGAHSSTPEAFRRDAVSRPAPIAAPPSTSTVCARCAMDVATATAYDRLSLRRGLSLANPLESSLPRQASPCKAPVLLPMRGATTSDFEPFYFSATSPQKEKGLQRSATILSSFIGAEGGTRTLTGFLPLPPQDSVSTNSTTSALLQH